MASVNRPDMTVPMMEGAEAIRCKFVHLSKPYTGQQGGNPTYQMMLMYDKQNQAHMNALNQIVADLNSCLLEMFPNEQTRPGTPVVASQPGQGPRSPVKDADMATDQNGRPFLEKNPECAGHYVISAKNGDPVPLVGMDIDPISGAPLVIDPSVARSGYWYKVNVNAYAWPKNGGGVSVSLNGAQLVREDAVIGGSVGPSVSQMFVPGGGTDPNMYQQPAGQQQPAPQQNFQQPAPQQNFQQPAPQQNFQQPAGQPAPQYPGGAEQYMNPGAQQPAQQAPPQTQGLPGGQQNFQQPGQQPII